MSRLNQCLLILLTLLFGCKTESKKDFPQKNSVASWLYVSIVANGKEFLLSTYDDTLTMNVSSQNDVDRIRKLLISESDKDSLYKWTEILIQIKPEPIHFCTDYYGKLTLRIDYSEQVSRQIQYRSICEWQKLDSNTSKMYGLLNKILKEK